MRFDKNTLSISQWPWKTLQIDKDDQSYVAM